jgi:hypothetical protein
MPRTITITTTFARLMLPAAITALLSLVVLAPVGAQTLTQECTNPDFAYTVSFPDAWYANARVEGGDLEDVAACRFFSPQEFDVRPQSEVAGIAIAISPQATGPADARTPDTEVGGKPAYVRETTVAEDGFEPAGTRHYDYWIEIGPDSWLVAGTSDAPAFVGEYEDNQAILDAMMDGLSFGSTRPGLPDTALPTP